MLTFYKIENKIVLEKPVQKEITKCSSGETEINPDNYIKNKTVCRARQNEIMRNRCEK